MNAIKIRELDAAEVERQAKDAQEQLFRLRFQMGMGQFEGLKKYRGLKKDRARLLTVLREQQLKQSAGAVAPLVEKVVPAKKSAAKKAAPKVEGVAKAASAAKPAKKAKPAAKKTVAKKAK